MLPTGKECHSSLSLSFIVRDMQYFVSDDGKRKQMSKERRRTPGPIHSQAARPRHKTIFEFEWFGLVWFGLFLLP